MTWGFSVCSCSKYVASQSKLLIKYTETDCTLSPGIILSDAQMRWDKNGGIYEKNTIIYCGLFFGICNGSWRNFLRKLKTTLGKFVHSFNLWSNGWHETFFAFLQSLKTNGNRLINCTSSYGSALSDSGNKSKERVSPDANCDTHGIVFFLPLKFNISVSLCIVGIFTKRHGNVGRLISFLLQPTSS